MTKEIILRDSIERHQKTTGKSAVPGELLLEDHPAFDSFVVCL